MFDCGMAAARSYHRLYRVIRPRPNNRQKHTTDPKGNPMIGKKNIVFGFLYLVLTAALGPWMIVDQVPARDQAEVAKQAKLGTLQQAAGNDFMNENLETMTDGQIARANTSALLALSARINADVPISSTRNAHAHGNLEALLNIAAGFLLCFVAISVKFKQLISWTFILGAVLHSGLLYLALGLQMQWAASLMATPLATVGPVLVLLGLGLAGVAALLGFRGEIVRDW